MAKIWQTVSDETNYIALHHQMLAYAMKADFDIPVSPENTVFIKFVAAK
jgi:peptide/nickel transport system substrate-binding protein